MTRIVATGIIFFGALASSATGATLSTPAIDRMPNTTARLSPLNPAPAACGFSGAAGWAMPLCAAWKKIV